MNTEAYLESMGITLCRRALFSYTTEPQGSFGLHVIFRRFTKAKKITLFEGEKEAWSIFLADYIVFRLYVAKYVLKDYAKDYSPLLHIFKGIHKVEAHFPEFFQEESDPGRAVGDMSFLPEHLGELYSTERMESYYEIFNGIATKLEMKPLDQNRKLKELITAGLSELAKRNRIPLYSPVFYFFSRETALYAQYLSSFYKGLIPAEFYEGMAATPYRPVEKKEDPFYTSYHLPAFIAIFVSALLLMVLYGAPGPLR